MAYRIPLKEVSFTPHLMEEIITQGNAYVYEVGTTTEASVYSSATDSSAETQPMSWNSAYGLEGYVDPGRYTVSAGGATQDVTVFSHDQRFKDYSLGYSSLPRGVYDVNYDYALTSGTVVFARIEPVVESFETNTLVVHFGNTADNSITTSKGGLYTSDGTTLTRVATSANDVSAGATADTRDAYTLSAAYTMTPGTEYWGAIIVVATTAPSVLSLSPTNFPVSGGISPAATENPALAKTLGSQTDLDATEAISGTTATWVVPYMHFIKV